MTSVVVVNAGSTSLKVAALDEADTVTASLQLDSWDGSAEHPELSAFLSAQRKAGVVGHRVVHGGSRFTGPVLIDNEVMAAIASLADLAPLHQRRSLDAIKAARHLLPDVPAVACFDTAFHAGLPQAAALYALPADWTRRYRLRRYGFHGLSHAYAARRTAALLGADLGELRIVSCHLGGGASLAAVQGGRSVDTTMGFTPLEGLVMATRSGSVDPGLLIWLLEHTDLTVDALSMGLEQDSGLAGLAELPDGSGDMREVKAAAEAGKAPAAVAIEVYVHRLRREIAAMAAAMNGLDALVFTGGVGENDPPIRAAACAGLTFLGVQIDAGRNTATADAEIGSAGSAVRVLVITAREDAEIARQAREVLAASGAVAARP
jgi:acetate kinase